MTNRVSGHFGEWLQGRLGSDGPVVLVTLPCDAIGVEVSRVDGGDFQIASAKPVLALDRASAFLEALGKEPRGRFEFHSDVPPGGGAGVSTASLLALAQAAGVVATPDVLANACLQIEGAVDPLMLASPGACLWSSREAREVEVFGQTPTAEIVGGFWGAPERTVPEDSSFPDISDLLDPWREAVQNQDLARAASLASASATRTSRLRGPEGDPTTELVDCFGALGFQRAHTGSARGLIFEPGNVPDGVEDALRAAGYANVVRFQTGDTA